METINFYNYTSDSLNYLKSSSITSRHLELLSTVIDIPGLAIEIIGQWFWITGNTYKNRGYLKQSGFKYYRPTRRWFDGPDQRQQHLKPDCQIIFIIHTVIN
jgi:hypothetical protein